MYYAMGKCKTWVKSDCWSTRSSVGNTQNAVSGAGSLVEVTFD